MRRPKTLLLLTLTFAAALLAGPSQAAAATGDFVVSLQGPKLELDEDPTFDEESDQPEAVNPRKERIKGGIKIGAGSGLLAAGVGLGVGSVALFVLAAENGAFEGTDDLYYAIWGFVAVVGVIGGVAGPPPHHKGVGGVLGGGAAATAIRFGIVLIVQGARHLRVAREAAVLRDPARRYAAGERRRVRWGMRFAMAPAARF